MIFLKKRTAPSYRWPTFLTGLYDSYISKFLLPCPRKTCFPDTPMQTPPPASCLEWVGERAAILRPCGDMHVDKMPTLKKDGRAESQKVVNS